MNSWIDLTALWQIVVVGLIAGAGLPALFAIGMRMLSLPGGARAQHTITQTGALASAGTLLLTISARVMTPIVFCASLVPCASETIDADPIWPIRKPCARAPADMLRLIR